jgi:CheY-like chemotaxis protein
MGGEIVVESARGAGSTFHFTLTGAEPTGVGEGRYLADRRLLVVSRTPEARGLVLQHLRRLGAEVVAVTGDAAVERATLDAPYDEVVVTYGQPTAKVSAMCAALDALPEDRRPRITVFDPTHTVGWTGSTVDRVRIVSSVMHGAALRRALSEGLATPPQTRTDAADTLPSTGPTRRVLLAEDNPVNQAVARLMLERMGCVVDIAMDGEQAVAMWSRAGYDIVFMDCHMPGMDGLEATRQIRSSEAAGHRTHIVAITADAMRGARERFLAAGMDDYISKPVAIAEITRAVDRWAPYERLTTSEPGAGHSP